MLSAATDKAVRKEMSKEESSCIAARLSYTPHRTKAKQAQLPRHERQLTAWQTCCQCCRFSCWQLQPLGAPRLLAF